MRITVTGHLIPSITDRNLVAIAWPLLTGVLGYLLSDVLRREVGDAGRSATALRGGLTHYWSFRRALGITSNASPGRSRRLVIRRRRLPGIVSGA